MRIPYNFDKCIVCLEQPCGDWEHVLPDVIGGRLQGHMLCNSCNHTFGSFLISRLKSEASIRLALEALRNQIPAIYARTHENATYIGNIEGDSVIRASATNNGMKILPGRGVNDSLILDTDEAANALHTKLIRYGRSPEEAARWKEMFAQLGEDTPLQIPSGEKFVKRPMPPLYPELKPSRIDDRLLVLIAFEFLSLLIGKLIFRPSFHPVRQYIRSGKNTGILTVEHFAAGKKPDTFHIISVTPGEGTIRVEIRLFRCIAPVVTLYGFDYRCLDGIYFEDLKTPRSLFAPTHEDAYKGYWLASENLDQDLQSTAQKCPGAV